MWKQAKESGVSLAELLVVLAITVVLAAILMPAINTPTHAEGGAAGAGLDEFVVAAGSYRAANQRIRDDHKSDEPLVNDVPVVEVNGEVEVMPALQTGEVETLERDGLIEFKTTDISYKLP